MDEKCDIVVRDKCLNGQEATDYLNRKVIAWKTMTNISWAAMFGILMSIIVVYRVSASVAFYVLSIAIIGMLYYISSYKFNKYERKFYRLNR